MNDALTNDEYAALREIGGGTRSGGRPSACVARNVKRLAGLKFVSYTKDGSLLLTEKGGQTLFIRSCIDALRALSLDPMTPLASDVKTFLGKKGHVVARAGDGGFDLTQRGTESLADIDKSAR